MTPETVERQRKLLAIFESLKQVNIFDEYFKIASEYDIKANTELYTVSTYIHNEGLILFIYLYKCKLIHYLALIYHDNC